MSSRFWSGWPRITQAVTDGVVEAPHNWSWLVDGLMEAGYPVPLANPAALEQYGGLTYTQAHSDVRWLAHMVQRGVLPKGTRSPKAERAGREVWRKRSHLVTQYPAKVLSV
jgi:hypothetical protein